jgi:hypothetical protein
MAAAGGRVSSTGNSTSTNTGMKGGAALPEPLTLPGCDLSDFPYMELDVRRLRDSKFAAAAVGEAFRAGILLWCAAWHQVPAASLPDDDVELANLAGYGRVLKEWKKVRAAALHGFVKCADGRLYHPVVAEKAIAAFAAKEKYAYEKYCDRLRKENAKRAKEGKPPVGVPPQALWKTGAYPHGMAPAGEGDGHVAQQPGDGGFPPEIRHPSTGHPPETGLKGNRKERSRDRDGDGTGDGTDLFGETRRPVAGATASAEALRGNAGIDAAEGLARDALWSAGKSLLAQAGMPRAQCGSFIGRLCKDHGSDTVAEAVRAACVARPADPAEYMKAVCLRAAGQRGPVLRRAGAPGTPPLSGNRQEALEQRNRSVADAWVLQAPDGAVHAASPQPPVPSHHPQPHHVQEPPHHASI